MRIHLGAIGRLKKGPETILADDYLDRIRKTGRNLGITGLDVSQFSESRAATSALRKKQEAEWLLSSCPENAVLFALDEHGKDHTSAQLASLVKTLKNDGVQNLAFLIGGPDGHDEALLARVEHKIALGRKTWPHRLARIMLAEQLYRVVTILLGHPYHRE